MAQEMGKEDIYKKYIERSQNYINVFDGATMILSAESVWMAIGNHLLIRLQWDVPIQRLQLGNIASLYPMCEWDDTTFWR